MPAVRVDRLAASHQLYVLLLACNHCVLPGMSEFWGFSGHEAFRISAGVEMMELKHQLKHHYKQQRLFPSQKASKFRLVLVY